MGKAPSVTILGAGLAGCECAWQLARRGHSVRLVEMRPLRMTEAHSGGELAQLVCSNSFRSSNPGNAVGLLKKEMERVGSLVMNSARASAVPAGDALAVDRLLFSRFVEETLAFLPEVELVRSEATELPSIEEAPILVVASGPLTSAGLSAALVRRLGEESLYFYDSIAPIVATESLDLSKLYRLSRWGKGAGDEYLNVPLDQPAYERFVAELIAAEKFPVRDFEKRIFFEGCLPIEVMAERGIDTLRHGPMKPFGLPDPATGRDPHAVVQLRQDDLSGDHWNLVGFQTKLTIPEQRRLFRTLPGFANAEFVRWGSMHRNTYINGPAHLDPFYRLRSEPRIRFAGQITGVEGYLESAAVGLSVGVFTALELEGGELPPLPPSTALGGLVRHVTERPPRDFQPSNVNWSLIDVASVRAAKAVRREAAAARALEEIGDWAEKIGPPPPKG
jgi:methylenetetrahydrofolate--tRNA-(uracil-5-)-methyltransferase